MIAARPVLAWAVLWGDGKLPGLVTTSWRDAQQRARGLRRTGARTVRVARILIIEQTDEGK